MKSKLNNMTYKIRCGLSSAYHSSFIHYHTLRTQYTPVYLLIHHLSYLEVFAHGVFLPRPLYLNVMFYLTNSTNSSDVLIATTSSVKPSLTFLCSNSAMYYI